MNLSLPLKVLVPLAAGAAISVGVAQADSGSGIPAYTGTSLTADTATTLTADTSTTLTSDTSTTLTSDTSTTIDEYHAGQIAFYTATIIKPLPPAPPIKKLASRGGGFSLPAHCNWACSFYAWAITDNVAGWLLYKAGVKTVGSARTTLGAGGDAKLKLALSARAKKRLRHARKPIKLRVVEQVVDSANGWKKSRTQVVTLRP